ncbi:transporter substrate-binding domain-containing protein [Actinomyces ruminis]|uniref:transporter substrate-binding domain-containing protein n=1 Tax=Actinomyces ruminis TaxID=1937003 RepID=UPI001C55922A|nr:transporter substrate-binding domain-containing protein [Actinomyces ruminis]
MLYRNHLRRRLRGVPAHPRLARRARALLAVLLGLALSTAGLAACSGGGSGASGHTIRIGIKFDQPGMGLKDGSRYTGFDVDMGRAIAAKLGYQEDEIVWVEAVSAQRETMLQNGQVDMVIGTYSITDARREKITFAGPYFIAGQDLLVRTDSDISGPDDMDGHILCSVEAPPPPRRSATTTPRAPCSCSPYAPTPSAWSFWPPAPSTP